MVSHSVIITVPTHLHLHLGAIIIIITTATLSQALRFQIQSDLARNANAI